LKIRWFPAVGGATYWRTENCELPAPGDWRLVRVGTQSLVLLRDESSGLRAFHNTCRHRGSVLCTEAQGNFARQRIVCPYHAWTYDLGGRLVATPRRISRGKAFELNGSVADDLRWPTAFCGGAVNIC